MALALSACAGPPARPPSPTQALADTSAAQALRAFQRADWALAQARYQAALQAAVALQDPARTGAALLGLSAALARQGDLAGAQAAVDQILADPQAFDAGLQARAATRKALLLLDGPAPDAALAWADRASALCAAPCALAPTLDNLRAHRALARGAPAEALALARAAGAAAQAGAHSNAPSSAQSTSAPIDAQEGEQAGALRLQGRALAALGQTESAATALAQALAIDRRLGLPDRVALDLLLAADLDDQRGRREAATALLQKALEVYRASGDSARAEALRQRLASR